LLNAFGCGCFNAVPFDFDYNKFCSFSKFDVVFAPLKLFSSSSNYNSFGIFFTQKATIVVSYSTIVAFNDAYLYPNQPVPGCPYRYAKLSALQQVLSNYKTAIHALGCFAFYGVTAEPHDKRFFILSNAFSVQ